MPTRVISAGGVPTTVANMDDVEGEAYELPAATTAAIGGVKKMTNQDNTAATDVAGLVTDFNALLTKLKAAGMM